MGPRASRGAAAPPERRDTAAGPLRLRGGTGRPSGLFGPLAGLGYRMAQAAQEVAESSVRAATRWACAAAEA